MFKGLAAWRFFRGRKASRDRKRASARPRLEALEDRLVPVNYWWVGGGAAGSTEWAEPMNWARNGGPKAVPHHLDDAAFFWGTHDAPKLSGGAGVGSLTVRSIGPAPAGMTLTAKTTFDLNDFPFKVSGDTSVYSAAVPRGMPRTFQVDKTAPGRSDPVIFVLKNSGADEAALITEALYIGFFGETQATGPQNKASMTIERRAKVKVEKTSDPATVYVGGKNVATLTIDEGTLDAGKLLAYGVRGNDPAQITVKNGGIIDLKKELVLGLGGGASVAPVNLLIDSLARVTAEAPVVPGPPPRPPPPRSASLGPHQPSSVVEGCWSLAGSLWGVRRRPANSTFRIMGS